MPDKPTNIELVRESIQHTNSVVFSGKAYSTLGRPVTPSDQSAARAVQSIGQTTAIVIQDAADMLRSVNTVEITAIGAATAKWLATKDPVYQEMIQASMKVMQDAVALYSKIGTDAYQVLTQFKP
jgi:hypothetical protein